MSMNEGADRLKARMDALGLRGKTFAAVLGVTPGHLSTRWRGAQITIPTYVWQMLDALEDMDAAGRDRFLRHFQ